MNNRNNHPLTTAVLQANIIYDPTDAAKLGICLAEYARHAEALIEQARQYLMRQADKLSQLLANPRHLVAVRPACLQGDVNYRASRDMLVIYLN